MQAGLAATFLDGEVARRRPVEISLNEDAITIAENGGTVALWPLASVRRVDGPDDMLRLTESETSPARLELSLHAAGAEAFARIPYLADRVTGARAALKIVAWSAAAGLSLILSAIYLVPVIADRATALVPLRVEQRLGQVVDAQVKQVFGDKACSDPAGHAALDALSQKLAAAGGLATAPEVIVLRSPVPNAMALPGGRIYILNGLLGRAQGADEIAGVIAHEMGHVAHRDGLRGLLRAGGTSFLIGLLFGDVTGAGAAITVAQVAINGVSSREAERSADRFASDALLALGRSPKPMGLLLSRLDRDAITPAFLRSHPVSKERLEALGDGPANPKGPLLTDEQWQALKRICDAS